MKKAKKILSVCFILLTLTLIFSSCANNHTHNFGEWTVSKEATCLQNGEQIRKCDSCDYVETQKVEASHIYANGVCSSCGEIKPSDGLSFTLNDAGTEYKVCGNNESDTHIIIPPIYNGIPVTSIDGYGFASETMKTITIPDSIKSIGQGAFSQCPNLESVTLPNGITEIPENTFFNCPNLTNVTIPNSVTSIGEQAFWCCTKLDNVILPNNITSIGEEAFYSCESLSSITIPDSMTYIEYRSFYDCRNLKTVILPDSIKEIKGSAFFGCVRLEQLYLGKGLTDIHGVAFGNCNKLSVIYYSGSSLDWANVINEGLDGTIYFNIKQP